MAENARPRVVVLGGGFAGLEALYYVRGELGDNVDLTLVSERDYFIFKPNTIYIPFGRDPDELTVDLLEPTRKRDIRFVQGTVRAVDPGARRVVTDEGHLEYDYLVVATGASMRPEEVPGLAEHALTPWTLESMLDVRRALGGIAVRAGDGQPTRLVFVVPPENRCSGPLYELALMTDSWLREKEIRNQVEMIWTTKEDGYIAAFGPRLDEVVEAEFAERGIDGRRGWVVERVTSDEVHYTNGERVPWDTLLSFPPYIARLRYDALPSDDRGFIDVEADSRRVRGHDRVWAVGDAADFPIKQAFLALLQADAAAAHIVADITGGEVDDGDRFEPMSLCVMEAFDNATFATVPLRYTDELGKGVEVAEDEGYRVGVSPLWRAGKKVLGYYVPWRFGSGRPFHKGLAWDSMDMGLKVAARALASE